jgi:precorrin-3B C17-methyltransferase
MSNATVKNKAFTNNDSDSRGKVFVVGTGPGNIDQLTPLAVDAIKKSTSIVGYTRYVDLITELIKDQKLYASGMMEEIDRCKKALELAENGEVVTVVSSGDPGIYGMAGLTLELNKNKQLEIEIVPGVSAVNAAASLLGAPLSHDFAVISLSDLLTPWEVIEKRIECAAEGDFVIAIYNPKSKRRVSQIINSRDIVKNYRTGTTPVGIVTNAFREKQSIVISNLNDFADEEINMLSVVIIGNSQTVFHENRLITPRGYQNKYAKTFT